MAPFARPSPTCVHLVSVTFMSESLGVLLLLGSVEHGKPQPLVLQLSHFADALKHRQRRIDAK